MKNEEISKDKLTITEPKPSSLGRSTIAVRQKESVTIDFDESTVQLHDFHYSFEEIIAIADQLRVLIAKKDLTFS
tara:strand:- start:630 stop:854 length:225 start_codon:yes stop_codon:yes gene_type:complete